VISWDLTRYGETPIILSNVVHIEATLDLVSTTQFSRPAYLCRRQFAPDGVEIAHAITQFTHTPKSPP
jgi:hypothetical protein